MSSVESRRTGGSSSSNKARSRSTAALPDSPFGNATVVKDGVAIAAIAMSSKPTTLISCGTLTFRSLKRVNVPSAIKSL